MKTMLKKGLYLLGACFLCLATAAQKSVRFVRSPIELANDQTEIMRKELDLTNEQQKKVGEINLKYAQQMEIAENATAISEIFKSKSEEFGKVLTSDQSKKWNEKREYWLNLLKESAMTTPVMPEETELD